MVALSAAAASSVAHPLDSPACSAALQQYADEIARIYRMPGVRLFRVISTDYDGWGGVKKSDEAYFTFRPTIACSAGDQATLDELPAVMDPVSRELYVIFTTPYVHLSNAIKNVKREPAEQRLYEEAQRQIEMLRRHQEMQQEIQRLKDEQLRIQHTLAASSAPGSS